MDQRHRDVFQRIFQRILVTAGRNGRYGGLRRLVIGVGAPHLIDRIRVLDFLVSNVFEYSLGL